MADLIYYDLKVAALISTFYLFYMLLLARETTHKLNRVVLLLGIVLSAVLPLCIVTLHQSAVIDNNQQTMTIAHTVSTPTAEVSEQAFDWTIPLTVVLLSGTLARLAFLTQSYRRLHRMIRHGERHTLPSGIRVCVVDAPIAPFSWMHTVVLSRTDWQSQPTLILAHEEAHVRHRHSYDIVVVEMLTALQWFNPVVWFLRQELRILHEYEADASVLSSGFDESQYIHLLMQQATGIQACALVRSTLVACFSKNGIHTPKTKKRILMMLKPRSRRTAWLKALYIVPIVLVSLAMTARTVVDYETAPGSNDSAMHLFNEKSNGRADSYQIRHQPGVRFFRNGAEEQIPEGRSIALELSKTTMQINGSPIDQVTLLNLPYGELREIHLTETGSGKFVCNMVTKAPNGNTAYIVNGKIISQEDAIGKIQDRDIDNVTVMSNRGMIKKTYQVDADNAVIVQTKKGGDDPVFDLCEEMPHFSGGDAKLMEFIAHNIKYPKVAIDNGVQGRVLVKFIVEKDGSLSDAKALEDSKKSNIGMITVIATMTEKERQDAKAHNAAVQALRDEAICVVNAMPRWTPGRQKGQTVRCNFVIPVTYRLN